MNFPTPSEKPLILLLLKRLVIFFFIMSAVTIFLYFIGTRQEFMDMTQLLLLRLMGALGLFLTAAALYGLALDLWMVFRRRKWHFLYGAGAYAALVLFGGLSAALASFITAAAGGNIR